MERGIVIQQPNVLGRSARIRRSISHKPSSDFKPVRPYRLQHLLCPDRGNDVKTSKDDSLGLNIYELMHALINIVEEFHRQGIRRVVLAPYSLDTIAGTTRDAIGSTSWRENMPDVNIISHSDHMTRTMYDIDKNCMENE